MNKVEIGKKYRTRSGKTARVICTDAKNCTYPVVALVTLVTDSDGSDDSEYIRRYTESGQYYENIKDDYDLIEVSPWDDFKVDEPVMVRDYNSAEWARRHFAGVLADRAATWTDGATSWSNQTERRTTLWAQCRRPTEEELQTKAFLLKGTRP